MYSKKYGVTVWLEQFGVLQYLDISCGYVLYYYRPRPNSLYVLKTSASRGVGAGYRSRIRGFLLAMLS